MRIWDIGAGFLNDQSLLGEHRELHGIFSIISNGKKGYSRHPETLRWVFCLPALTIRHGLLVAEMRLRGFKHHSPLVIDSVNPEWPETFIDSPAEQFDLLRGKYIDKRPGRIPLPKGSQDLWAAHKYSVMARDPATAKKIGQQVAAGAIGFGELAEKLVLSLRSSPSPGRLENGVSHMWGYVSDRSELNPQLLSNSEKLEMIGEISLRFEVDYLLHSTSLSELKFWSEFNCS